MGFETQEEAERWAENVEFLADQRREEQLLRNATAADLAWFKYSDNLLALKEVRTGWVRELTEAARLHGSPRFQALLGRGNRMKLHMSNKQLRDALNYWLHERFLSYSSCKDWSVRAVQIKPARVKNRVILTLSKPKVVLAKPQHQTVVVKAA